jgi:hypothetical protein
MTDTLVAIDVAVEPGETMVRRSLADNAKLLENFPQGYALDDTHHAHISMLQRFVREADLEKVYTAVADAVTAENPREWTLTAYKYYYIPAGPIAVWWAILTVPSRRPR